MGDISGEIGVNHTCGLMAAHYQGGVPDIEDPSACHRWFYVSRCLLPANWVDAAVADIVKVSRIRNDSLRLTGALLFTGRRFAQYIEGAAEHVAAVQESIKRDARHGEVQTILAGAGEGRLFDDWSLAYAGPSLFLSAQVESVLDEAPHSAARLIGILREFATQES
ncbi:BLUF domain-containing protein [Sphingomonas oryzagri]|uniref:BLUF domain-containing protein n=1 Tax=Sphingomonas oryzagri TaxID=3042314 RepID=A0ABT6MXR7_9SPHN|nr:BLUF domain-containing protein [Sphingomonas oryzagri]MDH7637801.1 BLUF domain-containing protein [Sphingomonas oryzagri]